MFLMDMCREAGNVEKRRSVGGDVRPFLIGARGTLKKYPIVLAFPRAQTGHLTVKMVGNAKKIETAHSTFFFPHPENNYCFPPSENKSELF